MIHPSYAELMAVVNSDVKEGEDINSIITSDEKRRLKIGEPMLVNVDNVKPLSIAVEEVNEGLVKILPADKTADEE